MLSGRDAQSGRTSRADRAAHGLGGRSFVNITAFSAGRIQASKNGKRPRPGVVGIGGPVGAAGAIHQRGEKMDQQSLCLKRGTFLTYIKTDARISMSDRFHG